MTKTVKIGIAVALVVVAILVVWFLMRKTYGANKYGSAAAVQAGNKGTYGAYGPLGSDTEYATVINAIKTIIPGEYGGGVSNADAYGHAWFKGMNIKMSTENVDRFSSDLQAYANNAILRKAHWDVTKGSFLNATPAIAS